MPVTISHLDHLVLTVTDTDRSARFYQRVLGMCPVIFGGGRRALEFGPSKINFIDRTVVRLGRGGAGGGRVQTGIVRSAR